VRLIAMALTASVLVTGAFVPAAPAEPQRHPWTIPHVLRFTTGEDIVGLNPHLNQQLTLSYMSSLTMAWLLRYDHDNRPVPELATAVPTRANGGVSADGRTYTYHLRRDARWSDGAPFTAADVVFSAHVVLDPANNEGTHVGFDRIASIAAPDPFTVVVHLRGPDGSFWVNFFSSAGANPCILPQHLLGGLRSINDAPYNALPVGIGPFKYASWQRGDRVTMVPDPLYFGRKPALQRVEFEIVTSRDTAMTRMTTHELDLWLPVPAAYYDRVRALPATAVLRRPSYGYEHLDFEVQHGPLRDVAVRRALRLALDRATIIAKVRHGVGILQETPFAPGHPYHIAYPLVPYDPAAAARLLDDAGWRRGPDGIRARGGQPLELTLALGSGNPDSDAAVELMRADWAAIGVAIDVKRYPSPLFFAPAQAGGILYGGHFDVGYFSWFTGPNGDLSNLFGCDRVPPAGQNVMRWCDPRADAAMKRFAASDDETVRRAAARTLQERIASQVPTIVTMAREDIFAYNDDLHGFHPNNVSAFDDLVDADI
jgi:peptide/nickel transport system substrate-binding protein